MMNKQFYQSLRKEINFAFTAERANNRSLIPDNIAEGGTAKPRLLYNDKGVVTGQREAVHAVATRPRGVSSCPVHANAFAHAKIVRAVNKLTDVHHAMVMYCHAEESQNWDFITLIAEYCWIKMEQFIDGWQRFKSTTLKPEKVKKLQSMVFNALLHFREGAANSKKLYSVEILSQLLQVSSSNWRRDWAPFWNQLLTILSDLEQQALNLVVIESKPQKAA